MDNNKDNNNMRCYGVSRVRRGFCTVRYANGAGGRDRCVGSVGCSYLRVPTLSPKLHWFGSTAETLEVRVGR